MSNYALLIAVLAGMTVFMIFVVVMVISYEKDRKRKRTKEQGDWLFHDFSRKVYSAFFREAEPFATAEKFGVKVDEYARNCSTAGKKPEPEKIVAHRIYALAVLIAFAVLGAFASAICFLIGFVLFFLLWTMDTSRVKNQAEEKRTVMAAELPRFLELLKAELEVGVPIEMAIPLLCSKTKEMELSKEFLKASSDMEFGADSWSGSLEKLARRYDIETLTDFVMDITTAYRKGTSVTASVERKAEEIKATHMLNIKEKAGKLNSKILLPVAIFQLIPLIAFITVPIILQALEALQ